MTKVFDYMSADVIHEDIGSPALLPGEPPRIGLKFGDDRYDISIELARGIGEAAAALSGKHESVPVAGYHALGDDKIALVNEGKALEELTLRYIEKVEYRLRGHMDGPGQESIRDGDPRFLAIGKTDIQKGWMMVYRAVFNPGRAKLPEDTANGS